MTCKEYNYKVLLLLIFFLKKSLIYKFHSIFKYLIIIIIVIIIIYLNMILYLYNAILSSACL